MAVDTEEVQETQATTEQAVAETTTQEQEQVETVATNEATTETTEAAAESSPEIPGQASKGESGKPWQKDRQRKDEEAAEERKRKAREETAQIARQAALEAIEQAGVKPRTQQDELDEITQAEAIESQARAVRADYRKALKEVDYDTASAKDEEYERLTEQALKLRTSHSRKLESVTYARDRQEQAQTAHRTALVQFAESGGLRTDDFLAAYDKARAQAAGVGYSGEALDLRVNEIMQPQLPDLKKKPKPPSLTQQTTKKTATPAATSTPRGTSVTPTGAGVRPAADQIGRAADFLSNYFGGGGKK